MCNNCAKDRVQNNNNNKSVEIKKDDKLAAGTNKKLIAQKPETFLDRDSWRQRL